jgi:hypothetical protein
MLCGLLLGSCSNDVNWSRRDRPPGSRVWPGQLCITRRLFKSLETTSHFGLGRVAHSAGVRYPKALCGVFDSPLLEDTLCLGQRGKDFPVQAPIAQLAVEAFEVGLFPGRSGLDVEGSDVLALQPVLDGFGDKLWAIIAPDMPRCAMAFDGCL